MIEYRGAVFFVDILGVRALTQGTIKIEKEDFESYKFKFENSFSEHQFYAKLLLKFRRILVSSTKNEKKVKVAQLSDCAFIWSDDIDAVVNVSRDIMWKSTHGGILCRGGLSDGQIVEPNKINKKLGMFICGNAATNAVKLESKGKGARIFINPDLVSELTSIPNTAFYPRKNPLDCTTSDEFLWFRYPKKINTIDGDYNIDKEKNLTEITTLISKLIYSPMYRWNSSSHAGRIQLASTIDIISSEIERITPDLDLRFSFENIINGLNSRSDKKQKYVLKSYLNDINLSLQKKLRQ
jgi:hypothetical protein